jgi:Zn ribbon nucleic-acid-binding protein
VPLKPLLARPSIPSLQVCAGVRVCAGACAWVWVCGCGCVCVLCHNTHMIHILQYERIDVYEYVNPTHSHKNTPHTHTHRGPLSCHHTTQEAEEAVETHNNHPSEHTAT